MQPAPFLGNGIASKSAAVTRQRRVNVYLENREDEDKTTIVAYGTPGLVKQFTLAAVVRGILGTSSKLYAVAGGLFYQLSAAGATLYSAAVNSVYGYVSMAANPSQVLVVDGVQGYIYQGGALSVISAPAFPNGAKTCTFVSSYFVVEQPGSQNFWVSAVNDGTTWPSLAFSAASQYEDNILAVDGYIANLIAFSERHTEFWQAGTATPQPFQPILSATSEYGLDAIFSRAHIANSLIFSAHNPQGTTQICRIVGYGLEVISTPDLDNIIASFPVTSDAVALSYVIDGHPMYQITFPSAVVNGTGRSFLYDCLTGVWSETQTGLTAQYAQRHTGNLATFFAGSTIITDYANGNVYQFSSTQYTDNGVTILREICSRHASAGFNVFTLDEVYLDMEVGVGLNSGQGVKPQVSLECSKDQGKTFVLQETASIGALGNYLVRVLWRRFGAARDFVFRVRMTDPVKFVITAGAVSARQSPQ